MNLSTRAFRLTRTGVQTVAVCGLAMFSGCVLMVALTLVPYWQSLSPQAFLSVFESFNELIPNTLGVVLLPTLVCVVASVALAWRVPPLRWLWLAAALCFSTMLALTSLYFLPLNAAFASREVPVDQVSQLLSTWSGVHWVRVALCFSSSLLAIAAVSSRHSPPRTKQNST